MTGRLLTTEELAERLRTSAGAVHAAIHRGDDLPPRLRTGGKRGRWLWPEDGLDEWLGARLTAAVPPRQVSQLQRRRAS